MSPAFRSPCASEFEMKAERYRICPKCDAYALGMELETGFPFSNPDGSWSSIQQWDRIFPNQI